MNYKIKNTGMKTLVAMSLMALVTISLSAQPRGNGKMDGSGFGAGQGLYQGHGDPLWAVEDLSDAQKTKLTPIIENHHKEQQMLRLDIDQKQLDLKRLRLADKVDIKAVEQKIDEIYELKAESAKNRERFHASLTNVLTNEQLLQVRHKHFAHNRQGKGNKRGSNGMRQGSGNCPYYGQGNRGNDM